MAKKKKLPEIDDKLANNTERLSKKTLPVN